MKIFALLLAAVLTGTALGVATSFATFRTAHGRLSEQVLFPGLNSVGQLQKGALTAPALSPLLVVDNENYDFGVLENGEEGAHPFVLRNDGRSPLEVELLEISCKCTSADLAEGRKVLINPGKSLDVKLSWHANSASGQFRQAAKLATNDPRRPELHLVVTGKVVKGVEVYPPFFHLVGLSTGQPYEGEVQIHSYRSPDFKVLSHEFSKGVNPELFDISFEPIAVDREKFPNVLAAVVAKLKIKPGLPIGTVSQDVIVKTNDARKSELKIAVAGIVDGPVSITGPNWIPTQSLLRIGAISREEGFKSALLLKIVDVDPAKLHPKVISVKPENLQIKLGEPRVFDGEKRVVVTYPVFLEVLPGGPVLTYLDTLQAPLGLIEIDTGNPETGILRMNVELVTVD